MFVGLTLLVLLAACCADFLAGHDSHLGPSSLSLGRMSRDPATVMQVNCQPARSQQGMVGHLLICLDGAPGVHSAVYCVARVCCCG